jgi:hypothetical protein
MLVRRGLAIVIVGLLSLLAGSCGGDDEGDGDTDPRAGVEGRPGLCANLQVLGTSLDKVQSFDPSTTLSEAQDARNEMDFVLAELTEAETNLPTRQIAELQASFQGFNAEIDSIASGGNAPGSEALGDAAASLRARATGISEVQATVSNEAECS